MTVCGEPNDVAVSVHNHGVPIPKHVISGIFEAVIRGGADGSDYPNSPNLGLGLYITKEIVAAHGGTIRVTSTEREGTTLAARASLGRSERYSWRTTAFNKINTSKQKCLNCAARYAGPVLQKVNRSLCQPQTYAPDAARLVG